MKKRFHSCFHIRKLRNVIDLRCGRFFCRSGIDVIRIYGS